MSFLPGGIGKNVLLMYAHSDDISYLEKYSPTHLGSAPQQLAVLWPGSKRKGAQA
jgi:hypothetical protein